MEQSAGTRAQREQRRGHDRSRVQGWECAGQWDPWSWAQGSGHHRGGSGSVHSRRGCMAQPPGAGMPPIAHNRPEPRTQSSAPPGAGRALPAPPGTLPRPALSAVPQPLRSRSVAASRPARCRPRSPRRPLRPAEDAAVANAVPPPPLRPFSPPRAAAAAAGTHRWRWRSRGVAAAPRPPARFLPPRPSRSLRPGPMSSRRGGKRSLSGRGKRRDPGSLRLPPPRRPPPAPAEPLRHRAEPPAAAWTRYALPRCPRAVAWGTAASVPVSRLTCRVPGQPRTALRGPRPPRRAALLGGQGINGWAGRSL